VTVPQITAVRLGGSPALPLLVLGPSLGTSARTLWSSTAAQLADRFEIVAWDLPGHGTNSIVGPPFSMLELAAGVLAMVDDMLAERGAVDTSFVYAGDSVGGAVGLHLLLDAPTRVDAAVLLCTGARIGEPAGWLERAATVRASGTPAVLEGSAARWFAVGFLADQPDVGAALLHALQDADREGYAQVCEALAGHDVRDRLADITRPVLAVAGRQDVATPPELLQEIAEGVRDGRLVVLDDVAHLAPAEQPAEVARLIRAHAAGEEPTAAPSTVAEVRAAGMAVRREVLGDAHVDRATAAITDLTAEFQDFITQYAWGSIWTRPGLDRRSRSLITLTALVARGHHEELAMHVRAARTNGVTNDEIKELLLQSAIYCGVPDANTAFRIAQKVLDELDEEKP
jgi:3-oxoadipate enol-lactonase/4-carboxymuconolactone decarboxylase